MCVYTTRRRQVQRVHRVVPVQRLCKFAGGTILEHAPPQATESMITLQDERGSHHADRAAAQRPRELPGRGGQWARVAQHTRLHQATPGAVRHSACKEPELRDDSNSKHAQALV